MEQLFQSRLRKLIVHIFLCNNTRPTKADSISNKELGSGIDCGGVGATETEKGVAATALSPKGKRYVSSRSSVTAPSLCPTVSNLGGSAAGITSLPACGCNQNTPPVAPPITVQTTVATAAFFTPTCATA